MKHYLVCLLFLALFAICGAIDSPEAKAEGKGKLVASQPVKKRYREVKKVENGEKPSPAKKAQQPLKPVQAKSDPKAEAEAFMASLPPLTSSGGQPLEQLIASAAESKVAKPYDPIKFVKARHNLLNPVKPGQEEVGPAAGDDEPKKAKSKNSAHRNVAGVSWILPITSAFIIAIILI